MRDVRRTRHPRVVAGWMAVMSLLAPAAVWASETGGHGFSLKVHGFYLINFIIFVAILVYVAGPAVKKAIKERSERTSKRLTAAREEAAKAGAEVAGARGKVAGMESEKASMLERMGEEGLVLEQKIRKRGQEEAGKIQAGAQAALAGESARLEKQLMTEVALEALTKAETQLKATWQSLPHDRYVTDFAEALKQLPPMGPSSQEKPR